MLRGKQWQATHKNLPRMQRTRVIPVAWLNSGLCPDRPKGWIPIIVSIWQLIDWPVCIPRQGNSVYIILQQEDHLYESPCDLLEGVYYTSFRVFSNYDLLIKYPVRKSESTSTFFRLRTTLLLCLRPWLRCYSAPVEMSLHSPAHFASNVVASVYSVTDLPSSLCLDFTIDPPRMHASAYAGIPNAELQHCCRITGHQIKVNCLLRLFANGLRHG